MVEHCSDFCVAVEFLHNIWSYTVPIRKNFRTIVSDFNLVQSFAV